MRLKLEMTPRPYRVERQEGRSPHRSAPTAGTSPISPISPRRPLRRGGSRAANVTGCALAFRGRRKANVVALQGRHDCLMLCHTISRQRRNTETAMTWDILIRHGTLIDGSGRPGTIGDIALLAGRIAALGPSLAGNANKVIDADGLAVTPGFIDIKTHSDFVLPINPKAESKVRQGVTTEIIGHCGLDRKSTRLNSSHLGISYAVFCLKKKKKDIYFVY